MKLRKFWTVGAGARRERPPWTPNRPAAVANLYHISHFFLLSKTEAKFSTITTGCVALINRCLSSGRVKEHWTIRFTSRVREHRAIRFTIRVREQCTVQFMNDRMCKGEGGMYHAGYEYCEYQGCEQVEGRLPHALYKQGDGTVRHAAYEQGEGAMYHALYGSVVVDMRNRTLDPFVSSVCSRLCSREAWC